MTRVRRLVWSCPMIGAGRGGGDAGGHRGRDRDRRRAQRTGRGQPARRRRLGRPGPGGPGERRRSGALGGARRPGFPHRPVQRLLPARRGLTGLARAGADRVRAALAARAGGARPPAPQWARRGPPPGPCPHRRLAGNVRRRRRPARALRLARRALLPARTFAKELFAGEGARLLLAGCTLHTDLTLEDAGGGVFGWLLAMLGQRYGFPVASGGAQRITDALVARLRA